MRETVNSRMVLGTAGHIDHGKTALVKALTGVDTDRLKEEKERGITIELGFASLVLPDSRRMAVVDVPGHERFVRNMVAGASGIDLLLFVVAADEGVMPQTREHLDICSLLGIRSGIVALTKADLVDGDMLELVREEVAELVAGTFLEGAPMIPVSSVTGSGIEELKAEIQKISSKLGSRDAKGLFRLPVDRVFTIKGFGTVVTGTALSGSVRVEDEVEILPSGLRAKVRGIEVHSEKVEKGMAGNRLALNFGGIGVDEISRGDTVVLPGTMRPTRMADAFVTLLPSARTPLANRGRFRLHVDTREAPVVVALLERDVLRPGESGFVQLRSPEQFVVCPGDRFVLRGYSPSVTVGGGRILDPSPRRHKGRREEVLETLAVIDKGGPTERLGAFLILRASAGLTPQEGVGLAGVTLEEARNLLQGLVRSGKALVADRKTQRHVDAAFLARLAESASRTIAAFHEANPLKKGIGAEELRSKFPSYVDHKLVAFTLERMAEEKMVVLEGETVRLSSFKAKLNTHDEGLRSRITELVKAGGFEGPVVSEVAAKLREEPSALRGVMDFIVGEKLIIRTKEGFYFDAGLMNGLGEKVVERLALNGEITVADIKEFTGTSRKYVIPILEWLDSAKITIRSGERRVAGPRGRKS